MSALEIALLVIVCMTWAGVFTTLIYLLATEIADTRRRKAELKAIEEKSMEQLRKVRATEETIKENKENKS